MLELLTVTVCSSAPHAVTSTNSNTNAAIDRAYPAMTPPPRHRAPATVILTIMTANGGVVLGYAYCTGRSTTIPGTVRR